MIETKAQQMVVEQDQGESVASIAERHGVSEQRVYAVRRSVGGSASFPRQLPAGHALAFS